MKLPTHIQKLCDSFVAKLQDPGQTRYEGLLEEEVQRFACDVIRTEWTRNYKELFEEKEE